MRSSSRRLWSCSKPWGRVFRQLFWRWRTSSFFNLFTPKLTDFSLFCDSFSVLRLFLSSASSWGIDSRQLRSSWIISRNLQSPILPETYFMSFFYAFNRTKLFNSMNILPSNSTILQLEMSKKVIRDGADDMKEIISRGT